MLVNQYVHFIFNQMCYPALFTNMSTRPKCFIVVRRRRSRSSLFVTWQMQPVTCLLFRPDLTRLRTPSWTFASFRLLITTFAPSWPSLSAIANPILKRQQLSKSFWIDCFKNLANCKKNEIRAITRFVNNIQMILFHKSNVMKLQNDIGYLKFRSFYPNFWNRLHCI